MIFFIGGPPRTGKTLLARKLAKKLNISWLSTDDLRWAVMESGKILKNDSLFTLVNAGEWDNKEKYYNKYSPEEIIKHQNLESREVVKYLKGFIDALEYRKSDFILEGVALYPPLISKQVIKKSNIEFICVGNTDYESFADYSWRFRTTGDWLSNTNKETFNKIVKYCAVFSEKFKNEAKIHNLNYFELDSIKFNDKLKNTINTLIGKYNKSL